MTQISIRSVTAYENEYIYVCVCGFLHNAYDILSDFFICEITFSQEEIKYLHQDQEV